MVSFLHASAAVKTPTPTANVGLAEVGARRGIVVLGGGIAGLTAARELLKRGCAVTLIEKEAEVGGWHALLSMMASGLTLADIGFTAII